jgi:xanthine/CO dehydrogenase XdhC/CoxF family maturation factor
MAYDASFEWAQPPRWRRWVARVAAVVALGGCAAGVYQIAHEAAVSAPPAPTSLQPQVRQVAASTTSLARKLVALKPRSTHARALAAVREAQADRRAAAVALRDAETKGEVADAELLHNALSAHRDYLGLLGSMLRRPRSRIANELRAGAKRAKAAWGALPDPAGLPDAIRGYGHVAALVRTRHR